MTAPEADAAKPRTTPPPDATASSRIGWDDVALIVLLIVAALQCRYTWAPQPSLLFPGIMRPTDAPHTSDPPSMDEVWDLAMTTGHGSPFDRNPRDVLMRQMPAMTSMADTAPWWKVWTTLDGIIHPPLYLQTLRFWRSVLGEGDGVAIWYSVVWSCVTVVFVYLAVHLAVGRTAAFWSGAILAAAPVASYFGLEIRSYAMLTAESAIAIWLLVRLTLYGPRWREVVALNVTLLACMLTHYFAAPACLAAGLYAMAISGRRWWRVLAGGLVVGGIYVLVWMPFFLRQIHVAREGTGFLRSAGPQPLTNLAAALLLPLRLLAELHNLDWRIASACAVLLLGITFVAIRRPAVRPFVVWYIAVAGFLLATDVARQMQQLAFIRYAAAAQPAAVVFVPVVAACLGRRTWVIHVCGALVCVIALYTQQDAIRGEAPTFTTSALAIAPHLGADDVLLLHDVETPPVTEFATDGTLLEFSRLPGCFPRDAAILYHPMSPQLLAQLSGRTAWFLSFNPETNPMHIVPGAKILATRQCYPTTTMPILLTAYRLQLPSTPATLPAAATLP